MYQFPLHVAEFEWFRTAQAQYEYTYELPPAVKLSVRLVKGIRSLAMKLASLRSAARSQQGIALRPEFQS